MSDTRPPAGPYWHGPDDEATAAIRAAGDSPANRTARRIVRLLRTVARLADAWTTDHAGECDCPYCGLRDGRECDVYNALIAVWQFGSVWADLLDDDTLLTPEEEAAADRAAFAEYDRRRAADATPTAVIGH
jgi:hypothetical protein